MAECQSCGYDDTDLVVVRRVYLTFATDAEGPGGPASVVGERVEETAERWCVPCATQYPCEWVEPSA